jgi:hypothetical protein
VAQSSGNDERLPWLESPRPPARSRTARAARRARTPLLILLGLFAATSVAIMAFLAGRGSGPLPSRTAPRSPAVIVAPLPPATVAPAPVAAPVASTAAPKASVPSRFTAKKRRASRPTAHRVKRSHRKAVRKPRRSLIPDIVIHRNATPPRAPAAATVAPQRRTVWPARPFAGVPGKVLLLGSFRTMAHADAAWWRVARAYPYLATLQRVVTYVGPTPGRARIYHLKLAAGSRREARILCRNLHRVGRGCAVL